jgi:hypothetical protein
MSGAGRRPDGRYDAINHEQEQATAPNHPARARRRANFSPPERDEFRRVRKMPRKSA